MPQFVIANINIKAIASCVPKNMVTLDSLSTSFSQDELNKFKESRGILEFRRAVKEQTSSDLGFLAAKRIFDATQVDPKDIGALIFISATPDYRSPASACVLQHRLQVPKDCVAYDMNISGAGFGYALQVGSALLRSLPHRYALIILGDTPSKQTSAKELLSHTLTDAGSAVLLEKAEIGEPMTFLSTTYSNHFSSALISAGGFRKLEGAKENLSMDFNAIDNFFANEFAKHLEHFAQNRGGVNGYDFIVIPQLRMMIADKLIKHLSIKREQLISTYAINGDARGSAVPLALLKSTTGDKDGKKRVLAGVLGEGFSIGLLDFTFETSAILPLQESDEHFLEGAVSYNL